MLNRASRVPSAFRLRLRARLLPRLGENGVAAVEFAIGALLLIIMAFGAGEFGLLLQKEHTLASTVRQAARVAGTPCIASPECKTGNRAYDDFYILRATQAGLGGYWDEVEKIVVYKISGASQVAGDGVVPGNGTPKPHTGTCAGGTPINDQCNVYDKNTVFDRLAPATAGVNLLKNLDAFEEADGKDNIAQLKDTFARNGLTGAAPDCGTGLSNYFCPVKVGSRSRNVRFPSYVGVYVELRHSYLTGLFGAGRQVNQWSLFALEPHPDDNSPGSVGVPADPSIPPPYDLVTTISDGVTQIMPGDPITYQITVSNVGTNKVEGAEFEDFAPPGLIVGSWTCAASAGSTCYAASGTGKLLGDITIPTGGNVRFTVQGTAKPNYYVPAGSPKLIYKAEVRMPASIAGDATPANNAAMDTNDVLQPNLSITKEDVPPSAGAIPGQHMKYSIVATNTGPAGTINGAVITDPVPTKLSNVTFTCTSVGGTCVSTTMNAAQLITSVVNLPANATATLTVEGDLSPTATGNLVNTATITAPAVLTEPNPPGLTDNSDTDDDIIAKPNLMMTKDLVGGVAPAGGEVVYTVTPKNIGGVTITGAVVTDNVAAILTAVTWTCVPGSGTAVCPVSSGTGNLLQTVNLPVSSSLVYTIRGRLPVSASGPLLNSANVSVPSPFVDDNPLDNTDSADATISPLDLTVTKTNSPAGNVGRGQTITYTVFAINNGPGDADGTKVVDNVPTNFTVTGWTCTLVGPIAACPSATGTGAINDTVNLKNGQQAKYVVTGTVSNAPDATLKVVNTATVSLPGANLTGATKSVSVTNNIVYPDLQILKTVNDPTAARGQTIIYTLVARNNGPTDVIGAKVNDLMPSQLSSFNWTCSAPAGDVCPAGGSGSIANALVNIDAGTQVTFTVNATVSAAAVSGVFTNTATITAPAGIVETNVANNTSSATVDVQDPDLAVTKAVSPTSNVGPGTVLTYTIVASNNGPAAVTNAKITDNVPVAVTNISWTCTPGGSPVGTCVTPTSGSGSNAVVAYANLPAGGSVTITITGTVAANATGTIGNVASVAPPTGVTDRDPTNNTTPTVTTTIVNPDPRITKSRSPSGNVGRGTLMTYTIAARNDTSGTVVGATVQDTVSADLTGVTWTCSASGGASCPAPSGSGSISQVVTLPKGGIITYTLKGTVSATAAVPGTLSNTATLGIPVTYTDSNTGNNTATVTNPIVGPDMSVTKTDGKSAVSPGQTNSYTIVAMNNGPVDVTGALITDTMPATFTGVTWTCNGGGGAICPSSSGSGNINVTSGNIPVSGTLTYTVTGTVSAGATGTINNTANVANPSGLTDPNGSNNSATDSDTITSPDLAITKTDGITTVNGGSLVTYTVVAKNNGPGPVTGAVIVDNPPASLTGVTWTCSSSGGATCPSASGSNSINAVATLPNGGQLTYTLKGTLNPTATGSLTNTATVATPSGMTDSNTANNSATDTDTINGPDLAITKTDGVTAVNAGQLVTYTIVARNNGPSNVTGATVTDSVSASLTGVTWTCVAAGGASCSASGSGSINQTVDLPNGGTATYTLKGTLSASATGNLVNAASVATPSGVTDSNPGNNSATDTDTINGPDLSITKTNGVSSVVAGSVVTYSITASNTSGIAVASAVITDTAPTSLSGVTWTCSASGGASCPASGSGNINQTLALPAGSSVTFILKGTLSPAATGSLVNTATVTKPVGDNTNNNSATDTDTITAPPATTTLPPSDGT